MSQQGQFRVAPYFVGFDGQSLTAATTYPTKLMAYYSGVNWRNRAVSGTSWTDLAVTAAVRLWPYAKGALVNVLVMCGGQSDIWAGDSGAQLYADEVAYADLARAAGFDVIVNTTLVGNSVNSGPMNTARLAHNVDLLADADDAFEYVVDLDAVALLADWTNATYYPDGVHWSSTAAQLAADTIKPTTDLILVP